MKLSKNIIKAMATEDMYFWINGFKNDGDINKYDEETQETYWNYINKMKERIFKEL